MRAITPLVQHHRFVLRLCWACVLLPARLEAALVPYITPGCQPHLVDLAADLGRNIQLYLSDKSCVELPVSLDLDAALQRLQQSCCNKSGQLVAALRAWPAAAAVGGRRRSSVTPTGWVCPAPCTASVPCGTDLALFLG
jgi:hypothetical protein